MEKSQPAKPSPIIPKGKDLGPTVKPATMDPARLNNEEDMMDSDLSFDEDFNMMD